MRTIFTLTVAAVAVAIVLIVTHRWKEAIVSEVQDAVDAITAQISKGTGEVVAEIAALEAQVAAGVAPDFTALKAAAQALDDLNPDPVVEPPA
jgi:predicted RNA polymerase sigma factor